MNINYLAHFYHVVRSGGFTSAAKELKTSQPNLSRSVRLLENDFDVILMKRDKNGISLTEAGKHIYTTAAEIFEKIDNLSGDLKGLKTKRIIRIGASENLCIHVFPKIVQQLIAAENCWSIDIYSGTAESIEEKITNLQLDMGFFYHMPKSSSLKQVVVADVEFNLVLPLHRKRSELHLLPYIGSRSRDYSKPYFALKALHQNGITPTRVIETNSQEAQLRMAIEGVGYTVVPEFMVKKHVDRIKIDRDFSAKSKLYSVFRKKSDQTILAIIRKHVCSS